MVGKVGVIVSIILFCIGVGFYSFARLSMTNEGKDADLLYFVPDNCMGILETDNIEFLANEFPQTTYAVQLDTLRHSGLFPILFDNIFPDANSNVHRLGNDINRMIISFHAPMSARNVVMYFHTHKSGKEYLQKIIQKQGSKFVPKKNSYRGEDIFIYPTDNGDFISAYYEKGFCAVSYQKKLIEQVIDAHKDGNSLREDPIFIEGYESKAVNFMAVYGRGPSLPLIKSQMQCWSSFDIHLNSEMFYLSGSTIVPDAFQIQVANELDCIPPLSEDSFLILSGQSKIDSCISRTIAIPQHTLFEECISNLSRDASFILVADMEKVAKEPHRYRKYLPEFVFRHIDLFRSFIISAQITKINNRLSHIIVFIYKN